MLITNSQILMVLRGFKYLQSSGFILSIHQLVNQLVIYINNNNNNNDITVVLITVIIIITVNKVNIVDSCQYINYTHVCCYINFTLCNCSLQIKTSESLLSHVTSQTTYLFINNIQYLSDSNVENNTEGLPLYTIIYCSTL